MDEMPEESKNSLDKFKFKNYSPKPRFNFKNNWQKIAGGLVILIALVLIGRQIHHHFFVKQPANTSGTSQQTATNNRPAGSNGSSSTPSTSKSVPSKTSKPSGQTPSQIANTGPGDTIGLFFGISAAAAGAHFIVSARKRAAE